MATDYQRQQSTRAALSGDCRTPARQVQSMTMTAGAQASGSFAVPAGTHFIGVGFETAAAFTGSPTNINARIGSTAGGNDVVADTDVKAQGHIAATVVSAFDPINGGVSTFYWQLTAVSGSSPAGTTTVILDYAPPNQN